MDIMVMFTIYHEPFLSSETIKCTCPTDGLHIWPHHSNRIAVKVEYGIGPLLLLCCDTALGVTGYWCTPSPYISKSSPTLKLTSTFTSLIHGGPEEDIACGHFVEHSPITLHAPHMWHVYPWGYCPQSHQTHIKFEWSLHQGIHKPL